MKIILSESIFNDLKTKIKNLCRDFFVGFPRGTLELHLLTTSNDPDYYAIVLLPNGEYGYIPKTAYKGIKKVQVKYHNNTIGVENRADVDESAIIKIDMANIHQLNRLIEIITNQITGFNLKLKYTNT